MPLFKRLSRSERTEKNYQKWLKSYVPNGTKQTIQLSIAITDRAGNNYYTYSELSKMPQARAIAIEQAILAIEYGVSKQLITEKLETIKTKFANFYFKQPRPELLVQFQKETMDIISDLQWRMDRIAPEDMMLQAALYFLLIDGENPYIVDTDANQRKWDICQADPEMKAFFLDTIEIILQNWHNTKG